MSGRSKKAEFAASYQIHTSLNQYVEENLFYHGLDSQPGFKSKGVSEVRPIIDGVINYQEWKNNPLAMRFVKENYFDRYLMKKGKKSWINQEGKGPHFLDKISQHLMSWTMFVGLALKPMAAVMNVSIGKYNEFGRAGAKPMWQGESRFWTDLV